MRQNSAVPGVAPASREAQRGSTLVEFALTVTVFLVMLFGAVDFGRALYTYHFLSYTARAATRWAAVNGATCADDGSCSGSAKQADVLNYVKSITPPGIDATQVNVTTCGTQGGSECADSIPAGCASTVNAPGCTVQVQISYNFPFLVPLVRGSDITLSSTSEMVIAH
jgi:Flp pilus assembly protein TadG